MEIVQKSRHKFEVSFTPERRRSPSAANMEHSHAANRPDEVAFPHATPAFPLAHYRALSAAAFRK